MNIMHRRLGVIVLGVLLLVGLGACVATGPGYVGGYYDPYGNDYGGWRPGYYVAPPRGGERREERSAPHAYRPAPSSRQAPSIPKRSREH
jgi:hypothetical protein